LYKIQVYGRGGQGAVQGGVILANTFHKEGKYVQKIPAYTGSRRLGTVTVSVKVDDKPIRSSSYVYEPDCIIVLSKSIPLSEIHRDLNEESTAILNETKHPEEIDLGLKISKIATVDATGISNQVLGVRAIPITNTAMLGAFIKVSGMLKLETLLESLKDAFPRFVKSNTEMAKLGYEKVRI
jgi:2-oxoacid:acceptor oxidoreductase gamma subunit (pyruvate/2-ketoisovalerate family)